MRKLIEWLDTHILKIGVGFLLFFIPLWPKLPLVGISNTWVYIRLEDIFLSVLVLIWVIKLLRGKVNLVTPLTSPIFVYWLVGGISLVFSLIFLAKGLANFFPHVAIFHYLRRIEYMVVFLIAFSTIKSLKDIKHYLVILAMTILGVIIYGLGQKLFGFPAFLTMNEEFAKGIPLYLPSGARITSTFAGHYDLAAYLVFMIPVLGSLIFGVRKKLVKVGLFSLSLLSLILLLLTASRVSFVVYLISISFMLWLQKKKILIIPVIILSIILMSSINEAGERFFKTLRVRQVVYDLQTGKPIATVDKIEGGKIITEKEKTAAEDTLPAGSGYIGLPVTAPAAPTTMTISIITKQPLATGSGEVATISGSFLIQKALVYDISFTTRLQGEWPRAMEAFKRNFLLGSGYSSITLATDNDYLRMLGETGMAGLFAFIFLFATLVVFIKSALKKTRDPLVGNLTLGVAAGLTGLFINAILIDVFEASKVAFSLWLILGITLGGLYLYYKKEIPLLLPIKKMIFHPLLPTVCLFIITFVLFGQSLVNYFVGDDFTWLRWAAQGSFGDIPSFFSNAQGFFYRPLPKLLYLMSFTVFWLMPSGYHILSLLFHFGTAAVLYLFTLKVSQKKSLAILSSLLFLTASVHGESIFWISTLGHTLSTLFILLALYLFAIFRIDRKSIFVYLLSLFFIILSLLSYEGAIVGPILIFWFEFTLGKKKVSQVLPFLLLVPAYIWLRNWAGALGLSGDYNYNLKFLSANFFGNFLGYLGLMVLGPNFMSFYNSLRSLGQSAKELFLFASGGMILLITVVAMFLKNKLKSPPFLTFSFGFIIISLLPFLGLGNISERYAYLASIGGVLVLALGLIELKKVIRLTGVIFLVLVLVGYYVTDLNRSANDWYKAGEITKRILLDLRKNYLKLSFGKTFYFAQPPIRYGRAWVFPVGLPDAIWHTFRDETIKVYETKTVDEALDLKEKTVNSHVFIFENNKVKEVFREIKQVPIK